MGSQGGLVAYLQLLLGTVKGNLDALAIEFSIDACILVVYEDESCAMSVNNRRMAASLALQLWLDRKRFGCKTCG